MITIIVLLLIYILSAFFMWLWIHKSYSKGGTNEIIEVDGSDLLFVFLPLVNTVLSICMWIIEYPIENKSKSFNSFFKIKK